jgi:molecular chaperone GrpE
MDDILVADEAQGLPSVTIETVYDEIVQLKDLFLRRLIDDKTKAQIVNDLTAKLDSLHLKPLCMDIALLLDRIYAHGGDDDFVSSIAEELLMAFQKYGLEAIQSCAMFNPDTQKAIGISENSNLEEGTVVAILRKGYRLNGVILRPEEVIIARETSIQQGELFSDELVSEDCEEAACPS